jgi:hypothetical protein
MVLIGEDGMAAALFIIIIVGAIRKGLVNNGNHTCKLCWVRPWIRRRPIFGAFLTPLTELSTEDPQIFRILQKWTCKNLKNY